MGQILLERQHVRGHQLGIAIAERFGMQFVSLDDFEPDPVALNLVPASAVQRLDVMPIAFAADEAVLVAVADPRDLLVLERLTRLIDRVVRAVVVTRDDLDELLARVGRIEPVLTGDGELELAGRRVPQDGRGDRPRSLVELGMGELARARLEAALRYAHGAILATGPPQSGKSTSLYAALALVSTDPDVMTLGELRDRSSLKIAIEAAFTGHLVLSSLNANSAAAAPARLAGMGIEPGLIASALDCVSSQRLARRLCGSCRRKAQVAGADVGSPGTAVVEIFEPAGCENCRGTGYRGWIGLFEVMTVSTQISALIQAGAAAKELAGVAVAEGMRTLLDDGLAKVRAGQTTLAEVTRVTG